MDTQQKTRQNTTGIIHIRMDPENLQIIQEASKLVNVPVSSFIKLFALDSARKIISSKLEDIQ